MASESRELVLRLPIESVEELRQLRAVLLSARAAELADVRRRAGRFSFGYGSESARDTMSADADQARLRMDLLERLLAALEAED